MKENIIRQKTFDFAIRIVNTYKHLVENNREYVLSKQLLRSGTSIGANVEEAIGGYSRPDFLHKLTISYKEARESHYWIRLLYATDYLEKNIADSLLKDNEEILRIIGSIQKSTRKSK